jgi:hypothetical protein
LGGISIENRSIGKSIKGVKSEEEKEKLQWKPKRKERKKNQIDDTSILAGNFLDDIIF